ncbi:hypothetical protein KM043_003857 [Ampulex compressa]|nr:hypothetical protein KM043_003857 [Ampulex compressa]
MSRSVIVLLCALVALAAGAPVAHDETTPVAILRQSQDGPNPDGSYQYSYETSNGIRAQEEGHPNQLDAETTAMEARGDFSFTAPDGQVYRVSYVANQDGFQPQGDHLPVAPPVPAQIARALEYIAAHPEENGEQ